MRRGAFKPRRAIVVAAGFLVVAAACSSSATTAPEGDVVVCELAYYTGEFSSYGPSLTNDVRFAVEEVVDTDPPLGRTWKLVSEDIGDSKEGQAAKTCLEQHGAEILVSIAHQYRTYRDYMMDYWQENDSPLGPSVHGGAIPVNLGGKVAEPIFRAQGADEALGLYGTLYAEQIGAKKVVIFATQVPGFQLAADANQAAADLVGLEVLARIDAPALQPSYRAEAQKIADLNPDAVLVQAGSVESATLIKSAAEAGLSLNWVGETGWSEKEFMESMGCPQDVADPPECAPIVSQKGIGFSTFAPNKSTAAWAFFQPLWDGQTNCASGLVNSDDPTKDTCPPYKADNQYAFSTYDLLVQTALAVEAGGSYKASDWAPAMFEVGDGGEVCYTYADCLAMIRDGKDIDYEGVTGPGTYTDGGVNAVTPAYLPFNANGTFGDPVLLDAQKGFEILDLIKTEADCNPADPPNKCSW